MKKPIRHNGRSVDENYKLWRLAIYSRDEFKQSVMNEKFQHPSLRFFLGDVRDKERLTQACEGVVPKTWSS